MGSINRILLWSVFGYMSNLFAVEAGPLGTQLLILLVAVLRFLIFLFRDCVRGDLGSS